MIAPEGMVLTLSRSVQPGHIMLTLDPGLRTPLPIGSGSK